MTDKKKLLKNFFNKYKNLPEQGSDEWLNIKKYTIGGSEIACVINKNSFLSPKNLIYNKLTDYKVDNIAVKWGNIYEPITNKTMELIFNMLMIFSGCVTNMGAGMVAGTTVTAGLGGAAWETRSPAIQKISGFFAG